MNWILLHIIRRSIISWNISVWRRPQQHPITGNSGHFFFYDLPSLLLRRSDDFPSTHSFGLNHKKEAFEALKTVLVAWKVSSSRSSVSTNVMFIMKKYTREHFRVVSRFPRRNTIISSFLIARWSVLFDLHPNCFVRLQDCLWIDLQNIVYDSDTICCRLTSSLRKN